MVGLVAVIVFYWGYSSTKNENRKLKSDGVSIRAVVYDVRVDRRLRYNFKFYFYPNGFRQEGSSGSARRINVGDTIEIIYMLNDYSINKPAFNVK